MKQKHNYRKDFEKEESVENIEEAAVENIEEAAEEILKTIGIVTNCEQLNIRTEPSTEASVACVIKNNDEVEIDEVMSTEGFYKVCTAAGVEGYCMKEFVTLK